ncbi:MAG: hypothetical protein DMG65_08280 [Candidatus Angelobacter sp. Gp1-AA117]|nr:MAG: hypothetical protein DMG65_08280 [Candidatus Angelobacter sp. Gp1-AA117]
MNSKSRAALLVYILAACVAGGQTSPPANTPPASLSAEQLTALVKQQFGSTFNVPANFVTPAIVADFDGDGIEDIAIVAKSKEPFPDSFELKYRIFDPYNSYFGLSDPQMSSAFSANDPHRDHDLLVIFGIGSDAWHAATPKAKFVLINVPFDSIVTGRMLLKKKKPPIWVIKAQEKQVMESAVYWDGKKWRWEPGSMLDQSN